MNHAALLKLLTEQRSVVETVLNSYLQTHTCPCAWPQFRYWVSKERPDGSYDLIQNLLVEAALALPVFLQIPPTRPLYWLEVEVHCTACGRQWLYFCEEWRMLGFHKQLVPVDSKGSPLPADLPDELLIMGSTQNLDAWVRFMQRDLTNQHREEQTP